MEIPILADTRLFRGDVVTVVGPLSRYFNDRQEIWLISTAKTNRADIAFIAAAIIVGALIGSLTLRVGSVPLTLSTAGGVLLIGLMFGWLRSIRPAFGRVPQATTWFMNSIGLNMFIAVVGLSAGPSVLSGTEGTRLRFRAMEHSGRGPANGAVNLYRQIHLPLRQRDPARLLRRFTHTPQRRSP